MKPVAAIAVLCIGIGLGITGLILEQSLTTGPASADIAELRREKMMIQLCDDAIRKQQVVKRGPYEARPAGDGCVVYQLVYGGER